MKILQVQLLLVILFAFISAADLFAHQGSNWEDKSCKIGVMQSPINIIEGLTTTETKSQIKFNYTFNQSNKGNSFKYDGSRIILEVPEMGILTHTIKQDKEPFTTVENYKAYRIEIKVPSEHYVTIYGQTIRANAEIQIHHTFHSSDNPEVSNKKLKVVKCVVSFLLEINEYENGFLAEMGITRKLSQ